MTLFLAQETFEGYQGIAVHESIVSRLVNPFDPAQFLQPGSFFYPFVANTTENFLLCLLFGLLVLWVHRRVNDTPLFQNIALGLFGVGLVLLAFFRTAFPSTLGMLALATCLYAVVLNFTVVVCVAAVQKLPYFGLDEKVLSDPRDGSVRPWLPYAVAALLVLGPYWMIDDLSRVLLSMSGNIAFLAWVVLAGMITLVGMVGNEILPWRVLTDHPILGGGYMRELAPIFSMPGPATRGEVMLIGIGGFVAYLVILFLFKSQVTGADMLGLFLVATVALNIIRAELARSARSEVPESKPLRKSAWH